MSGPARIRTLLLLTYCAQRRSLRVDLPPTAIGKDFLGALPVAKLPSGTGAQLNLLGVAGIAVGLEEGIEVNLLGLTFGLDRAISP